MDQRLPYLWRDTGVSNLCRCRAHVLGWGERRPMDSRFRAGDRLSWSVVGCPSTPGPEKLFRFVFHTAAHTIPGTLSPAIRRRMTRHFQLIPSSFPMDENTVSYSHGPRGMVRPACPRHQHCRMLSSQYLLSRQGQAREASSEMIDRLPALVRMVTSSSRGWGGAAHGRSRNRSLPAFQARRLDKGMSMIGAA